MELMLSITVGVLGITLILTNFTIYQMRKNLEIRIRSESDTSKDRWHDVQKQLNSIVLRIQEVEKNAPAEVSRCPQCEELVPSKELVDDYICHSCRGV